MYKPTNFKFHITCFIFMVIITALAVTFMSMADNRAHADDFGKSALGSAEAAPRLPVLIPCGHIETFTGIMTKFHFFANLVDEGDFTFYWDYDGDGKIDWTTIGIEIGRAHV